MEKLSVVIITYNEERNIGRCLESVRSVADEILVVDSFSTDATESICRQYDVRFVEHAFAGHIEQKNYAADMATYDHVLSVDADEELSEQLQQSILSIKNNFAADGYYIKRLSAYCGHWIRHCGWYPDRKLRLWDRRKGRWGGVNPHDKFIMHASAVTANIDGDLLHYTAPTVKARVNTINSFADIAARQKFIKGKRTNILRIIFKPKIKFFLTFIIKFGFLDGYYGYLICKHAAYESFLKEINLHELQKMPPSRNSNHEIRL